VLRYVGSCVLRYVGSCVLRWRLRPHPRTYVDGHRRICSQLREQLKAQTLNLQQMVPRIGLESHHHDHCGGCIGTDALKIP
jgi:ribonuclease I